MAKNTWVGFILLLAIISLLVGFFMHKNLFLIIGFILGIIGSFIAMTKILILKFKSYRKIKEFSKKFSAKPFVINETFSNGYGYIPFKNIEPLAEINPAIKMFRNRYWIPSAARAQNTYQNQLCFLLNIDKFSGGHRIIEKNAPLDFAGKVIERFGGNRDSEIETGVEEIDDNFVIISNNFEEVKNKLSKIYPELIELKKVFQNIDFTLTIDNLPTNFEIQIKNNSLLFRFNSILGFLIEDIYPILINIQKKL